MTHHTAMSYIHAWISAEELGTVSGVSRSTYQLTSPQSLPCAGSQRTILQAEEHSVQRN